MCHTVIGQMRVCHTVVWTDVSVSHESCRIDVNMSSGWCRQMCCMTVWAEVLSVGASATARAEALLEGGHLSFSSP